MLARDQAGAGHGLVGLGLGWADARTPEDAARGVAPVGERRDRERDSRQTGFGLPCFRLHLECFAKGAFD